MALLDDLTAAREGAAAKLAAALTGDYSSAIEFKPNFNSANGADRVTYIRELRETITDLTEQIQNIQSLEEDGPYMGSVQGFA